MRALVVHQAVAAGAAEDEQDVLFQADSVVRWLRAGGHEVAVFACSLDLEALRREVVRSRPQVVVNLVESLAGTDTLMALVPLLLESLAVPFTGSPAAAILRANDKLLSKVCLREHGLPTPEWWHESARDRLATDAEVIVKAVGEHASFGLSDASIVRLEAGSRPSEVVRRRREESGKPHFAERFVRGREFNLSLLEGQHGAPLVLPVAEIDFSRFPSGKPRIVGYSAKWVASSFEYAATPRAFLDGEQDAALQARLRDLATQCWEHCGMRGYARVDFRVDAGGKPWILEVNANPCLSPDAGFIAACERAGLQAEHVVELIVAAALRRGSAPSEP